ncbi:MAG: cysteine--tRNA ligase, partial [Deltaproteobacteria bacterium]|nr:cysteine--tRNA ligase [Deltaproteobacteria bacterium]
RYHPEVLRFFLLTKHYRSPLDYSDSALDEAEKGLRRLYQALAWAQEALGRVKWANRELDNETVAEFERAAASWTQAMDDDLNTAGAVGHMFTMARIVNRILEDKNYRAASGGRDILQRFVVDFSRWSQVLGVLGQDPKEFLAALRGIRAERAGIDTTAVESMLIDRQDARKAKDFQASDAIRDQLAAMGVTVRDTAEGQEWDMA